MLNGWHTLNGEELTRIERGIIENRVYGGPFQIELQPTNLCNLDCFFCISRIARHGESLDWPLLRDFLIANRRRDLRMVRLTGGGEPLAYKYIRDLVDLCGEQGILLENITTNGTLLAPLARPIVEAGLGWLTVSLNESDSARYARTMRVPERRFHEAVDGVRAIAQARDAAPAQRRPRIWLQYFLWKGSAPYITQMYEFARALGVDTIYFRTIFGEMGHEKLGEADRARVEGQLREIIREDCTSGENRLHFELSQELALHHFTYAEQKRHNPPISENFPDYRRARPRTEYCFVGWYTCSINPRGDVLPCLQYHELPGKEVGNIYHESLDEIWRGERMTMFRDQIQELMRLRGRLEPSRKYSHYVERKCTQCEKCHYIYNLAAPDFYARVARGVRARVKLTDLARDYGKNALIYLAHRVLRRPY